ncbi:phf1/phf2 family PHD finger domain-containing protein [Aspergillus tanneri]|nr:uncharacterized protein ATNIH1004_008994 [Aspergillus tanneri]KAA8644786.1 hypothetical protein ATNIH1004_008994 [Aspergillus tanneri]
MMAPKTPVTSQQTGSISTAPKDDHGKPPSLVTIAPKPSGPSSAGLLAAATGASATATAVATQPPPQPVAPAAQSSSPAASSTTQKKPATSTLQRRSTMPSNGTKRKKRRRRWDDSDGEGVILAGDSSSDESNITPTATQTKSGRQVNRPSLYVPAPASPVTVKARSDSLDAASLAAARKRQRVNSHKAKDKYINCIHCQRGHSPTSNAIVFCDGCNQAWHQRCHDPPINAEVVSVKEKEWLCRGCKPVEITITQPTVVRSNPSLSGPSFHPPTHHPVAVPTLEVGGERFSIDDRRGFLSRLSHATLVELLVTISNSYPTMPMFPNNLKALPSSQFSFRSSVPAVSPPSAQTNSMSSTSGAEDITVPSASAANRPLDESSADSEDEFMDHRLYPRAGNGIRLSTNVDDLDILREDVHCPTFSYAFYGSQVRA